MKRVFFVCAVYLIACLVSTSVEARTTFLPDYLGAGIETKRFDGGVNRDENLCAKAVSSSGVRLYHKATKCPRPKIFDEYCPFDDDWISECYCPDIFSQDCTYPYRGDTRVKDPTSGSSSCDGYYVECCDYTCPSGTTESNPGGCGGYTYNDCGDRCYYPYEPCCTPLSDDTNCSYGTETCSDGCGGTRTCCKSCSALSNETGCQYGTYSCSDGCGGTRTCCSDAPTCTPLSDETGCVHGTYSCSDGCGGTRTCCSAAPDCTPLSNETGCQYGTESCSDGCGGTRTCCSEAPACTPYSDETGCNYGTYSCSDGCGGTRTCCSAAPSCTPQTNETGCAYGTESCSDGCGGTRICCKACSNTCSTGSTSSDCTSPKTATKFGTTECGTQCYTCSCPSDYKYACSGTGYKSGSGTACDSKYKSCECSSGYSWSDSSCVKNSCTVKTCSHATKQTGGAWSCSACTATSSDCTTSSQWNCNYDECRITSCPTNAYCSSDGNGKNPKCTCSSGFLPFPQNGVCVCDTDTFSRACQYDVILFDDLYNYSLTTSYGYKIMHSSPCAYCVKSCTSSDSGCSYGV